MTEKVSFAIIFLLSYAKYEDELQRMLNLSVVGRELI